MASKSVDRPVPMRRLRELRCETLEGAGPKGLLLRKCAYKDSKRLTRDGSRICGWSRFIIFYGALLIIDGMEGMGGSYHLGQ